MQYFKRNDTLSILMLAAILLIGSVWAVAQSSSDDDEDSSSDCIWQFKHDLVISTFQTGNITATASATVNVPSSSSNDGYFYDECNGTLYRIAHNDNGQVSATAVSLD